MSKYICQACGADYEKWNGRCENCKEWGSLREGAPIKGQSKKILDLEAISGKCEEFPRIHTNIKEFDNVVGGGLTRGSVILVGGDPGIGKSTLLLQIVAALGKQKFSCLYVSGEESANQIRMRGNRLKIDDSSIKLLSATNLESIIATGLSIKTLDLMIVDSIQTIYSDTITSTAGSIAQVKLSTHELVMMAKSHNIIVILIGHITKDGAIAGPKFLEHMVDTVLYFEGDGNYRIIRSIKNRYGATNEVAVFEMTSLGLSEVHNPSSFFIHNQKPVTGSVIFAGIEGTRPILTEIQILLSPSYMPMPRRAVVGWDANRLSMIIAVLSARCGINIGDKEIYLNVVGGMKLQDPSADLAVAGAIISFVSKTPLQSVLIGEIGLTGEIRSVPNLETRLKEIEKLGFKSAIIPNQNLTIQLNIKIIKIKYLHDLVNLFEKVE